MIGTKPLAWQPYADVPMHTSYATDDTVLPELNGVHAAESEAASREYPADAPDGATSQTEPPDGEALTLVTPTDHVEFVHVPAPLHVRIAYEVLEAGTGSSTARTRPTACHVACELSDSV